MEAVFAGLTSLEEIRNIVLNISDRLKEKGGLKNVYCVACGGSNASFYPLEYVLKTEAENIPVHSISANEFNYATPVAVCENTVVFTMSMAGATKETVEATKVAKKHGAIVVSLTTKPGAPIEEVADYKVYYGDEMKRQFARTNMPILLQFGFELLHVFEGYSHYEAAMDGMNKIQTICEKIVEKVHDRALEFAEKNKDEKIIYTVASGPNAYVAYMQSICMFMEMEWINSSYIHAGEFFHGPFEVTDQDTPFLVFMNEGRTRALDERALKFLKTYGKKIYVIDSKELGVNLIQDEVVEFFNPIFTWIAAMEYDKALADAKQHPLFMRRYMYKVEY